MWGKHASTAGHEAARVGPAARIVARLGPAAAVLVAALAAPALAGADTAASSNWAGYAVTGAIYRSVSATWTQPAADCAVRTTSITASAFWIGLGGDSEGSQALEQAGTEADCTTSGLARYSAWYELVPSASVRLPLAAAAGDRVSARVTVSGHRVTVAVDDLTTRKIVSRTVSVTSPDVSSAEWIAEAPSAVTGMGTQVLPLTDFGSIRFSSARATTTGGRTGTISDPAWTATGIALATGGSGPGRFARFVPGAASAEAVPGVLADGGSAFTVAWRQTEVDPTAPAGPQRFPVRAGS